MGYAIVGYFDKKTDEKIRELWKAFMLNGVGDYLYKSENNPHIKFVMYDSFDEEHGVAALQKIANQIKNIDVTFKSYSFYPNECPFLNIDMAVSMELLKLQALIRQECDPYSKLFPVDYFENGIWKPDCQLTTEIDRANLNRAVDCLAEKKLPIKGKLERIGLLKFPPAKQIVNFDLTKN